MIYIYNYIYNKVKGWIHDSPHPHDTGDSIRCFYCKTCPGTIIIHIFFL